MIVRNVNITVLLIFNKPHDYIWSKHLSMSSLFMLMLKFQVNFYYTFFYLFLNKLSDWERLRVEKKITLNFNSGKIVVIAYSKYIFKAMCYVRNINLYKLYRVRRKLDNAVMVSETCWYFLHLKALFCKKKHSSKINQFLLKLN